jgi:hypothetical protein
MTALSDPIMGQPLCELTPDRSRIRSQSQEYRATAFQFPAPSVPGLRPVSIKGIQAALRAARTLP